MGPWPQSHGYHDGWKVIIRQFNASMGPWPQSHGYEIGGQCRTGRLHRFNGAMAAKPWIPACAAGRSYGGRGFNGAMAAKPWIRLLGALGYHGGKRASMGPWPQSHGYSPFSGKSALMMPPVSELIGAPARPALLLSAQTHCPPSHNLFLCEGFLLKESSAAPLAP